MNGRNTLIGGALALAFSFPNTAYASCAAFLEENGTVEGVVPRLDDNGKIRSFGIFGEASFLVPKRSLISKARRKASLRAKRAFVEWTKESLNSESVVTDLMEQVEKTDASGNTEGVAEEVSAAVDTIRTQASAVISGLIKLDECVDREEKMVIVMMGWKPSLSKAAADVTTTINKEVQRGDEAVTERKRAEREGASSGSSSSGSADGRSERNLGSKVKIRPVKGYRARSKLKDKF